MLSEISQRQRENDLTYMWILKKKKKTHRKEFRFGVIGSGVQE